MWIRPGMIVISRYHKEGFLDTILLTQYCCFRCIAMFWNLCLILNIFTSVQSCISNPLTSSMFQTDWVSVMEAPSHCLIGESELRTWVIILDIRRCHCYHLPPVFDIKEPLGSWPNIYWVLVLAGGCVTTSSLVETSLFKISSFSQDLRAG